MGSRWDVYEKFVDDDIHWLSIINSIVVILLLTFTIGYILRTILKKDINFYRSQNDFTNLEAQSLKNEPDDQGWK